MKSGTSVLVLFVLTFLVSLQLAGQGTLQPGPKKPRTLEDYTPRMLKEIEAISSESDLDDKQGRMIVRGNILPSRVTVTYTGSSRSLPEMKREVIRQWARLYAGAPEHYTKPYETELLFEEEGARYWIAAPQRLLAAFKGKVKQGEGVDLFLISFGKANVEENWEPVLLVEQFKKRERQ